MNIKLAKWKNTNNSFIFQIQNDVPGSFTKLKKITEISDEELMKKLAQWLNVQQKRFGIKKRTGSSNSDEELSTSPPWTKSKEENRQRYARINR